MLKNGLITLFVLITGTNYAQQNYFVLIQSDNNQPFYVRMAEKTFPSSPHGYLVLPQLQEGDYAASIGFPGHPAPDQQFSFSIHKKDLDLQLKDLGDKGWGLFNPKTQEWKMSERKEDPSGGAHQEGIKKDDAFSRLMAGVVNDTAVMYNNYAAAPLPGQTDSAALSRVNNAGPVTPRPDSVLTGGQAPPPVATDPSISPVSEHPAVGPVDSLHAAFTKTDSLHRASGRTDSATTTLSPAPPVSNPVTATATPSVATPSVATPSVEMAPVGSPAAGSPATGSPRVQGADSIFRLSERWFPRSIRIVYADQAKGGKTDTIQVIIPLDTALRQAKHPVKPGDGLAAERPAGRPTPEHASPTAADTGKIGPAATGSSSSVPVPTVSGGATTAAVPVSSGVFPRNKPDSGQKKAPPKLQVVNSDCKNFASDYDVDRLRVKMLEGVKDEDRIQTARKVFRSRCFTTKQIRALSEVFTTDALRYRFFEAAYPFVADDHFYELSDLLADPAYNSKFKIMTGH